LTDATVPGNCDTCSFTRSVVTVVPVIDGERVRIGLVD
jgi:hypothetical protein